MSELTAYPLQWPAGYHRTARPSGAFRFYPNSVYAEVKELKEELGRMNGRNIIISTKYIILSHS